MKNSSFSVLFMRDDTDVKSFRVSPRRLKLLLWIGGALALVVAVTLAVGMRSLVGYRALLNERRALESRLAETEVTLERVGNIEKMQKSLAGGKDAPDKAAHPAPDKAAPGAAPRAFAKINTGSITVENFRGQISGASLTASFDLNNRASGALSGDIRLLLLRNDGALTELEANPADLTYQIQRSKRISATVRIPEGIPRREALGLRVEIKNSDGEVVLGETYALGY